MKIISKEKGGAGQENLAVYVGNIEKMCLDRDSQKS